MESNTWCPRLTAAMMPRLHAAARRGFLVPAAKPARWLHEGAEPPEELNSFALTAFSGLN